MSSLPTAFETDAGRSTHRTVSFRGFEQWTGSDVTRYSRQMNGRSW